MQHPQQQQLKQQEQQQHQKLGQFKTPKIPL
jgi:hypothetical protein